MKQKNFERVLLAGSCILAVILLVSHNYNDILITTRHGINLWDILLDGDFLAFYDLNRCVSGNVFYPKVQGCAYNILVYITFALWNLPLYLLERFAGMDVMNSIPCLVYAKLLPAIVMLGTVVLLKKILETLEVPEKQHKLMLYLYGTSTVMMSIIFIAGQYDIFSLALQLLGFHAYIKKDDRKFLLWFSIAFCYKYFAGIIFLPLLLLRRKKIMEWIRGLIALVIPLVITKVPFVVHGLLAESVRGAGVKGDQMAAHLLGGILGTSNANVNINFFMVAYACILVWCYLQDDESENRNGNAIWACLVAYASFFGLLSAFPYWSILLTPFVVLALTLAPHRLYLGMILETVGMAGLVFTNMVRHHWVYFGETLAPMIWGKILKRADFVTEYYDSLLYRIIRTCYYEERFSPVVNSIFVAAMICLAYIAYTGRSGNNRLSWPEEKEYRDVLVVRFLANTLVLLLPIICLFL